MYCILILNIDILNANLDFANIFIYMELTFGGLLKIYLESVGPPPPPVIVT